MKQFRRMTVLVLVLVMILSICALAAGETLDKGMYLKKGDTPAITVTPVKADGTSISPADKVIDSVTYSKYADAEKLIASCAAKSGSQYLVLLIVGDESSLPTVSNIIYINQKAATGSTVTFGDVDNDYVYPNLDGIKADTPLTLFIIGNDGETMKKVEFLYAPGVPPYTLGNVDESPDGNITVVDALMTLKISAQLITPTPTQLLAADVNGDGDITVVDALLVLQRSAELISEFPHS